MCEHVAQRGGNREDYLKIKIKQLLGKDFSNKVLHSLQHEFYQTTILQAKAWLFLLVECSLSKFETSQVPSHTNFPYFQR